MYSLLLLLMNCRSYMRVDSTLFPIPIVEESIIFIVITMIIIDFDVSHLDAIS
jgi:hypothetical protein